MPCISPFDGKPTNEAKRLLQSLIGKTLSPEEISGIVDQPLFKVRSRLRELKTAEWVEEAEGKYRLTEKGTKALE
jgi:predicted transcriptional regulator